MLVLGVRRRNRNLCIPSLGMGTEFSYTETRDKKPQTLQCTPECKEMCSQGGGCSMKLKLMICQENHMMNERGSKGRFLINVLHSTFTQG